MGHHKSERHPSVSISFRYFSIKAVFQPKGGFAPFGKKALKSTSRYWRPCSPAGGIPTELDRGWRRSLIHSDKLQGIFLRKVFCLIFDSLANPAALVAGFPLRSNKLRGMHSLWDSFKRERGYHVNRFSVLRINQNSAFSLTIFVLHKWWY